MRLANKHGWLPGARYTNLRDIRGFDQIGLIDIDWKAYSFDAHLRAVKAVRPLMTVARDLISVRDVNRLLEEVAVLRQYARYVIVVPKTRSFKTVQRLLNGRSNILGYSVPTGYGATHVPMSQFGSWKVHLLGGRPTMQFNLARQLNVVSLDCNSITIDAAFGKYFNGKRFIKDPKAGYMRCLGASLRGINKMWDFENGQA